MSEIIKTESRKFGNDIVDHLIRGCLGGVAGALAAWKVTNPHRTMQAGIFMGVATVVASITQDIFKGKDFQNGYGRQFLGATLHTIVSLGAGGVAAWLIGAPLGSIWGAAVLTMAVAGGSLFLKNQIGFGLPHALDPNLYTPAALKGKTVSV